MPGAIESLDRRTRQDSSKLNKTEVAAATEVSKVIALAMLGLYDEAIACAAAGSSRCFSIIRIYSPQGRSSTTSAISISAAINIVKRRRFTPRRANASIAVKNEKQLATINNCLANTHVRSSQILVCVRVV
jgi:hypothetical protein